MSGDRTDAELFDAYYFAHGCGHPYQRDKEWLDFFGSIADRIVSDIQPKTVLDAGCAMGFLVEALRERGVEAYGIDISEYAIDRVHEDVKEYCWVGSVADPLPQSYDLIVCIEVLEHLPPRDAEAAVEILCRHTDDILFSSTPFDFKEVTHFNLQPPEYWAKLFAQQRFYRDLEYDASYVVPWTVRFRKAQIPVQRVVASYERRMWRLIQENQARRELALEQREDLAQNAREIEAMHTQLSENEAEVQALHEQWEDLQRGVGWLALEKLRRLRLRWAPRGSRRDRIALIAFRVFAVLVREGLAGLFRRLRYRTRLMDLRVIGRISVFDPIAEIQPLRLHHADVDIIICVHNALEDVRQCLESVIRYTYLPYRLILVDDGSDPATRDYLDRFQQSQEATLLRNEQAKGYARAANRGLQHSEADFVVLLNSDTVVTPHWLDRMVACAEQDPKVGLVGPLSNTASWQSIPERFNEEGDWAPNPLPVSYTAAEYARLVAKYSARLYPRIPFLNGFCMLIKRNVIEDLGYFDDKTFAEGYGEENDYCLRSSKGGWALAVADDAYVFHAQSRSYSHARRKLLTDRGNRELALKHGQQIITAGVELCRHDRILQGARARSKVALRREQVLREGRDRWEGKRILFIMPITEPGGGGHVILQEARSMQRMGVDVRILNLEENRRIFEASHPGLQIPVLYVQKGRFVPKQMTQYDAVIGTVYHTINWLQVDEASESPPIRAYYIQDFEPSFFHSGSRAHREARESYARFPDLIRFTKTEWNRRIIEDEIGVDSTVIGPSVDFDLYRPRRRRDPGWPERPLRIAAMIRPSTPRRRPAWTMEILREFHRKRRGTVEIILFGCHPEDPEFRQLPTDFSWQHAGILAQAQLAKLLNEVDIFVDFSSSQAMGLTALNAMACGVAVIVPEQGGSMTFARHNENAIVVDTRSKEKCLAALDQLIDDETLRTHIQRKAIFDVCEYAPEFASYNFLDALFP